MPRARSGEIKRDRDAEVFLYTVSSPGAYLWMKKKEEEEEEASGKT
jgi:hypothetical protein